LSYLCNMPFFVTHIVTYYRTDEVIQSFLSQRVYNWCLGIFSCSVIISTVLTTVAVLVFF